MFFLHDAIFSLFARDFLPSPETPYMGYCGNEWKPSKSSISNTDIVLWQHSLSFGCTLSLIGSHCQTCSQYVGSGKWCVVKHSSLQWYLGHLENFIISISDPLFFLMVWSFCSPHGQSIKHTRRHRMGNKHEPEHICYFSSTDLCSINNAAIRSSLSVKVWTLSSLSK